MFSFFSAILCPVLRKTTDLSISLSGGPGTEAPVKEALLAMSTFIDNGKVCSFEHVVTAVSRKLFCFLRQQIISEIVKQSRSVLKIKHKLSVSIYITKCVSTAEINRVNLQAYFVFN